MTGMSITNPPRGQRGISLIVVLILLLIMTLLGLAVLRGTQLEERMAGNLYDRSLSFQAAETALREGERIAAASPAAGGACASGLCPTPVAGSTDRWKVASNAGWAEVSPPDGTRMPAAWYIVEDMGEAPTWPGCDRMTPLPAQCLRPSYRITARSVDQNRAQVILQSNYIVQ